MSDEMSLGAQLAAKIGSNSESLIENPSIDPEIKVSNKESLAEPSSPIEPTEGVLGEEEGADKVLSESPEDAEKELSESKKVEDDKFAHKFAALSRKERQIKQREAEFEAKMKEFEDKQARLQELESLEENIVKSPMKWLKEKGIDFDTLTQMELNDLNPTPEMQMERLEKKFSAELEEKVEALRRQYEEEKEQAAKSKYEQTINDYMEDLTDFVNSEEEYELIRANDAVKVVFDVVEEYYETHGKVLSPKEASDIVESHLYDEAQKLLKLKKFQAKKEQEEEESSEPKLSKEASVTLSNSQSTQVPSKASRKLSNEESIREAAKLIRFED